MICNKCGRNNPAGAEKCSFCKESMPETTNCGGFSDILTYSAPTAPDVAPAVPNPVPVRHVVETPVDTPWYADIFSRKNIISLAAIALCVITLIVVIVSCAVGGDNNTQSDPGPGSEKETANSDTKVPEEQPKFLYKLEIGKKGRLEEGLSLNFSDGKAEFLLCDSSGDYIEMFESEADTYISEGTDTISIASDKTYTVFFFATEEQFPLTLCYGKDKDSQLKLTMGADALDWSEIEESDKGNEENTDDDKSIPDWVTEPVSGKEKQGIFYAEDLVFPEGAKTVKLVVKGGNSRNIDSKRVFVVGLDGNSLKTDDGIYTKEEFENIKMIIINAKADSELADGNEVKAPEFKKES